MNRIFSSVLILFLFVPIVLSAQNKDSVQGDFEALQDLYNETVGTNWWNQTGWESMTPETMGDAVGVTTDASGRVIELNMQIPTMDGEIQNGNNLTGELPLSIGNLKKLEVLKLKTNKLTGPIPETIGNLVNLRWLSLAGQKCDVSLEDSAWNENVWTPCPGDPVTKEWQQTNNFTGGLPASIGNLVNLEVLEIRKQTELRGTIPPGIGNLTNLIGLFLNSSNLEGEIPDEIGNLVNLRHLHIDGNLFSGSVPESVLNMRELRHIRLGYSTLSGPVPIFDTYDLRVFQANANFTGSFPIEYFQGKNPILNSFMISGNNLSGPIPDEMIPATLGGNPWPYNSMAKFGIDGTGLSGELPDWVLEMTGHQVFNVTGNNHTGQFPAEILNRKQLKSLTLRNNDFYGPLPNQTFVTRRLITLMIDGNRFTGTIPDEWEVLTEQNLSYIYFHDNLLEGPLPEWLLNIQGNPRFWINDNKLVFADILPIFEGLKTTFTNLRLGPQKPFGRAQSITKGNGDQFVIDFTEKAHPEDVVQWYKNGQPLSGETSHVLTISSVQEGDAGTYEMRMTNPLISDWVGNNGETMGELRSEPIELIVGDTGTDDSPSNPPAAPVLSSPSDGANNISVTPTFEWSNLDADYYILHVSASNPAEMVIEETVNGTSYTPDTPLVEERNHQWRVRGVKDGVEGEWSSIANFTTQSEEDDGNGNNGQAPQMLTPSNDENNVSKNATFTWGSVEDAELYIIEVREASDYSLFLEEEVTDTIFVSNSEMNGNTEYVWRVRATVQGQQGEWSDDWAFTTEEENEESAFEVELSQNYPNPFNPSTNIRFTIAEQQEVSLKVYDMAGRLVANLIDSNTLSAGSHSASFNAQSLASGIYFYRLITPSEIVTRKMTLMK